MQQTWHQWLPVANSAQLWFTALKI